MSIKILIAEDEQIIQKALKALIESMGDIRVVDLASNGKEAVLKALKTKPDIVFMDMLMPVMNGLDATRELKKLKPSIKVIALTVLEEGQEIIESLSAGINGYILKKSTVNDLRMAIDMALEGKRYICPQVADYIANRYEHEKSKWASPIRILSPREIQVMELLCVGMRMKQIAEQLGICTKTAEKHKENIRRKLKVDTTVELVSLYLKYNGRLQ